MRGLGILPQQAKFFGVARSGKLPKTLICVHKSYACYSRFRSFFQNPLFQIFHQSRHRKSEIIFKNSELKIGVLAVPNVLRLSVYASLLDTLRCTEAVLSPYRAVPLLYRCRTEHSAYNAGRYSLVRLVHHFSSC